MEIVKGVRIEKREDEFGIKYKVCCIIFYNGKHLEELTFNVDYLDEDKHTWFIKIMKEHTKKLAVCSYIMGKRSVQTKIKDALEIK